MAELFRRLGARPGLTAELVVATVFVTLLALATPLFVIQVLNRYLAHGVDATLATLTAGAVLAVILEYGFREVRLRLAAALSAGPDAALSNWAFATLTRMRSQALSGLSARRRQDLMQGPDLVQTAYAPSNLTVLLDLPFALLFVGALYLLSPVLAGIALVFIAANLIMALVGLRLLKAPTKALSAANAGQAVMGGTAIHGGDTIRAFNAGPFLRRAWRQHRLRTDGLRRRVTANNGRLQSLAGASGNLMTIATIAVGAMLVVSGHLTVGAMIGANILSRRALVPFSGLARMAMPLARAREVLSSLEPLTRVALEPAGGTTLPAYGGGLELRDLAFAWRGARTPLFEGLSLTLAPGESLVVTGGNGSGKTTLARLLVGLMEPSRGQVLADGVDLRQLAPAWWRRQVAYLPQEPLFLNLSLRDNVCAGLPLDEAAFATVIDQADLRRYVDESPQGADTLIPENGRHLALGIRRRLALARALATTLVGSTTAGDDAAPVAPGGRLLVFDEPTEGLDPDGRAAVLSAMGRLARAGHSLVVFTHDPRMIKGARYLLDLNIKPRPKVTGLPHAVAPAEADAPASDGGALP